MFQKDVRNSKEKIQMVTVVSCDYEECANNENGQCMCTWGIHIDSFGDCEDFEERVETDEN